MVSRFPNDSPKALVRMQAEHWDPLFAWLKNDFGVELNVAEGFLPAKQSEDAVSKLKSEVEKMDHWELAGESASTARGPIC